MQVTECGMSDAVGPVFIDQKLSGDFQKSIDAEVMYYKVILIALCYHLACET
jgi:hypothetical protein